MENTNKLIDPLDFAEDGKIYNRIKNHGGRQPWADTQKSWPVFQMYRDMGVERTIQKVWEKSSGYVSGTKFPTHWLVWSAKHRWVDRCAAYDKEIAEEKRKAELAVIQAEQIAKIEAFKQTQEVIARGMAVAVKNLTGKMIKWSEEVDLAEMPPQHASQMLNAMGGTMKRAAEFWYSALGLQSVVDDLDRIEGGEELE
jgi:hypothetical protein